MVLKEILGRRKVSLRHGEGRKYILYEKEVGISLWLQLQVPRGEVMGKEAG